MSDNSELRNQLNQLHLNLEKALRQEPMDKDILGHVMRDIVRIAGGEDLHPEEQENLKEQIEHRASDFELKHPRLAETLREVMDILAKIGI